MTKVLPSTGNGEIPEVEDGTYPATCYQSRDSVIPAGNYGEFSLEHDKPVVILTFMLDDVTDDEERNVMIDTKGLTISSHEKATLPRFASALLGRNMVGQMFDTEELIASRALVEVKHSDSGWPFVSNVMALPKSMVKAGV